MNDSNVERGTQSAATELPPAYPKCRIFNCRRITQYCDQLKAAGETVALAQIAQAVRAATYQPIFPTRLAYCRN